MNGGDRQAEGGGNFVKRHSAVWTMVLALLFKGIYLIAWQPPKLQATSATLDQTIAAKTTGS